MKKGATKHKPTKKDIRAALAKLKQVKTIQAKISAMKDELRDAISDIEDICNSLECGEEQIVSGLDQLQDGLEHMSQYV